MYNVGKLLFIVKKYAIATYWFIIFVWYRYKNKPLSVPIFSLQNWHAKAQSLYDENRTFCLDFNQNASIKAKRWQYILFISILISNWRKILIKKTLVSCVVLSKSTIYIYIYIYIYIQSPTGINALIMSIFWQSFFYIVFSWELTKR